MKEKGMDELFGAVEKLRKEGYDFVLDWLDSLKMSIRNRWNTWRVKVS